MTYIDGVHRCEECGTWCYAYDPCTTCAIARARAEQEAS